LEVVLGVEESEEGHCVLDFSGEGHAECFVEGDFFDLEDFGGFGFGLDFCEVFGEVEPSDFGGDTVAQVDFAAEWGPFICDESGFFAEFALGGYEGVFAGFGAAFDDLP